MSTRIAPHETFELHEIITLKNISATKAFAMAMLVKDEELKALLQEEFRITQEQVKELKELLMTSDLIRDKSIDSEIH